MNDDDATGIGVDAHGNPVIDPTKNVLDLVEAAIRRQDDLRVLEARWLRREIEIRAQYDQRLREAESARIDAIRSVDVGAVQRAAEVQLAQATALATQQATMAETLRTQVAAAATASATSLGAALVPLQEAIADLRRAQYEAQGSKTGISDGMKMLLAIGGFVISMIVLYLATK
jgi:hypothetical protein